MGFIMDGLDAEGYDREYSDSELVRRIVGYFRPERWRISIVSIAVVLNAASDTLLPIAISFYLDRLVQSPETFNAVQAALVLSGVASISWVFNFVRQWLSAEAVGNVTLTLREEAFNAVTERDMSFYDKYPSGKVVSRVSSDTQAFSEVVRLTINLLSQLLIVVFLVAYLLTVNAQLTLVLLGISPIIIFVALQFRTIARKTVTNSRRIMATVNAHVQETVSGIGVAKAFRREGMIYNEFNEVNNKAYSINLLTGYTFGSIFPVLITIASIGTGAIVWFGLNLAQRGSLTAGEWFLFIQGMQMFWFPLTSISSFWSQFQLGLAAGERVFALIDADLDVVQVDDKQLADIRGEIAFQNVDFHYVESEPVLQDFSLQIEAGETLALVGHTGSGKSSITKLITRFYEFQAGQLLIDDVDIRQL
ncbi:MAG: ABC transporter ATP-binding protein, partial [Chloroflexota bacterium]